MTTLDDQQDPEETAAQFQQPTEPELGRKHYWRGKELAAYSYNYRAAMNRLLSGGATISQYEYDFLLVFLLLQKPATVDQVRSSDQITAFRLKVGEWVEKDQLEQEWDAITRLVASIEKPVAKADELEPSLPPGTAASSAPGNV
jgi:hypothetical protein